MPENAKIDADMLLNAPEIQRLAGRRAEIERLADSEDGKRVRALLAGADVENAARSGDLSSVASAVRAALSTEEGSRLANRLRGLLK
ncbi:MAG: hypothetical protein LBD49_06525 [Oscillospiraceae bacterium]|jgi:hypothetical protein|nr:hypothetical protein [Oscillospiraceae bacterium]